ncbi:MAG: sigma-54-dependent Fis family transcriptional regulator [Bacillus thermozeamaize]|uniref:Sigma-54-dependent Fis family transcriptional regulator n=1 Tax=Bacillus thermozeamaize TaxID=230954 RepID=A0A1Y3PF11_9BACI|nr:MAG: sigma-54-dependent Fis family transcriptional regulator [Bacillus thermozeamaize]
MDLKKHFLSILESLYDAVIVIDRDSTIVYINQAYTRQFGVPPHKLIGRKLRDVEPNARILDVLRDGKPRINDYSYVHSLGQHVYANMTPLIEEGQVIGVVTIMKDISEIKTLQKQLENYRKQLSRLEEQLYQKDGFTLLESQVPSMQRAVSLARRVAPTDATVLLTGETGVGKELFAQAIHQASERRDKPFIPVNMVSIPDTLFESEMFGYEEGSFTGSRKGGKRGLIELAQGGTLFLDEIGEMSLSVQAKMLRVLQEHAYRKVGGTTLYPLDVRIICATNRDLQREVQAGRFREDLYYRLNVVPIHIPPLRERKEDLPRLVNNLVNKLRLKYNKHVLVDDSIYGVFCQYDWPGNVRELSNVLERMFVVCNDHYLKVEDIPESFFALLQKGTDVEQESGVWDHEHAEGAGTSGAWKEAAGKTGMKQEEGSAGQSHAGLQHVLEQTERAVFERVLRESRTRTEAIRKLGISRRTFYERLKRYGLG